MRIIGKDGYKIGKELPFLRASLTFTEYISGIEDNNYQWNPLAAGCSPGKAGFEMSISFCCGSVANPLKTQVLAFAGALSHEVDRMSYR